ncbi:hypothetical protein KUV22_10210 [Microbulbifer agarilyticus]|uniref:hypothetical protein n=1 Tax=Microbulbifer agarilyticus TaxID=260552 RepID=UPI001C9478DA|nr:hypothetical protein [Microbulbifer agarilyticus]MBY6190789.1 hypothetical protein [Microbulbifer agarilyticus]
MKKLLSLIAVAITLVVASLYWLDHQRQVREQQQEMTAHLITRCVNQGLLSLFVLQSNDWAKQPKLLDVETRRLKQQTQALPDAILVGKPFADWQAALDVCDRLTENSNRQHKTIFRPLADMAKKDIWELDTAKSAPFQERRKKAIYRSRTAAEAADQYMQELEVDVKHWLDVSRMSPEARALADQQLREFIFQKYHKGRFSKRRVLQYLERQEAFYQLLTDNTRGFTLRGGSLFFYNKTLHRKADDLNRSLMHGEADFFANWRQIVVQ